MNLQREGTNGAAGSSSSSSRSGKIEALPQLVVDRIAAGEVVQRPSSVIKELIENSLDAGSGSIDVCVGWDNRTLMVKDDGCGISRSDLKMAATRFATSKLKCWEDLKDIATFGFRGEALASASMVGRLSIASRHDGNQRSSMAFSCNYQDGQPTGKAQPCALAGASGTLIQLQDLFYNVPARLKALQSNNTKDEYHRILAIVQKYAIAQAHLGVGLVCRRHQKPTKRQTQQPSSSTATVTDLNTTSLLRNHTNKINTRDDSSSSCSSTEEKFEKTKQVIAHIFGANIATPLKYFEFREGDVHASTIQAVQHMKQQEQQQQLQDTKEKEPSRNTPITTTNKYCSTEETIKDKTYNVTTEVGSQIYDVNTTTSQNDEQKNDNDEDIVSQSSFAYEAHGLITMASSSHNISKKKTKKVNNKSPIFILFINGRLVESSFIKKSIENAYINMNNEERQHAGDNSKPPFCFLSLSLPGPHIDVNVHPTKRQVALLHQDQLCQALEQKIRELYCPSSISNTQTFSTQNDLLYSNLKTKKTRQTNKPITPDHPTISSNHDDNNNEDVNDNNEDVDDNEDFMPKKKKSSLSTNAASSTPSKEALTRKRQFVSPLSSARKSPYDPKNLVRINPAAPSGALEPYLVPTQPSQHLSSQLSPSKNETKANHNTTTNLTQPLIIQHEPDCEFFDSYGNKKVDMTQPGAFAQLICRCQLKNPSSRIHKTPTKSMFRGKRPPTIPCELTSIINLRNIVVSNQASEGTISKLRNANYVGTLSKHRSLIQSEMELLMIHHTKLAKELFYQLALNQFSNIPLASMGQPINVNKLLEFELQYAMDISDSTGSLGGHESKYRQEQIKKLANEASSCLETNREMLKEYFSIHFEKMSSLCNSNNSMIEGNSTQENEQLMLIRLPILLEGHSPAPHGLSRFLLRLAMNVNWMEEEECFHGILTELGSFYAEIPFITDRDDDDERQLETCSDEKEFITENISDSAKKFIQHQLFPAISYLLTPSSETLTNGSMSKLAVLSKLYKVFERC